MVATAGDEVEGAVSVAWYRYSYLQIVKEELNERFRSGRKTRMSIRLAVTDISLLWEANIIVI